ncbi:hypothetical protein ACXYX3_27665 (plasmid) [Mycobacterium sp. C3-094]
MTTVQPKKKSARPAGSPAPQSRLNVNINKQTADALKDYADRNDVSITEAVRRLVAVGDFIAKAQDEGRQVLLRHNDDTERVVFTY